MEKAIALLQSTRQTRLNYIMSNYKTDLNGCENAYRDTKLIDDLIRDLKAL